MADCTDLHQSCLAVEPHDCPIVTYSQRLPRFRAGQRLGEARRVAELVADHRVELVEDSLLRLGVEGSEPVRRSLGEFPRPPLTSQILGNRYAQSIDEITRLLWHLRFYHIPVNNHPIHLRQLFQDIGNAVSVVEVRFT